MRLRADQLRELFDIGQVGVAILSSDGCFSEVNRAFCEFLGYAREELLYKDFSVAVHPDTRAAVSKRLQALRAGQDVEAP